MKGPQLAHGLLNQPTRLKVLVGGPMAIMSWERKMTSLSQTWVLELNHQPFLCFSYFQWTPTQCDCAVGRSLPALGLGPSEADCQHDQWFPETCVWRAGSADSKTPYVNAQEVQMGLGSWPIAALVMEILMQKKKNVTSSCFTWDVQTETDPSLGMLCIS